MEGIPAEGIVLGDDLSYKAEKFAMVGAQAAFLSDPELWENWEDDYLFEAEKLIRGWMTEMTKNPRWRATNSKLRKYTFAMVFELITGERYEQKKHAKYIHSWTTVLKYYSSRVQRAGSINGKMRSKTIYVLSPKRLSRPPLSLRLRFEWLAERGIQPNKANMMNPQDELLEPGHARNPRTEETMRKRREAGRARYNERYRDREH